MGILEQKSYGAENRFSLWSIEQEGLHITGQCTYYQVEGQTPAVRKIDGTQTADSTFWPDVTSQVFNEETKKWETISEPFKHGHRGTVTIRPGEVNQKLFVSLDVFLPFVTRYKTGRLVLEAGGEIATFPLNYLLEDSAAGQPKH